MLRRLSIATLMLCGVLAHAGPPASREELQKELDQLQKDLADSKQNLLKSRQRLSSLKGGEGASSAQVAVIYRNDMTVTFTPLKCEVFLDGASVAVRTDPMPAAGPEVELYRGALPPGEHQLTVALSMKGSGRGKYTYLKDYRYVARAGHEFRSADQKLIQIKIVSLEKQASSAKDRPAIDFQDSVTGLNAAAPADTH